MNLIERVKSISNTLNGRLENITNIQAGVIMLALVGVLSWYLTPTIKTVISGQRDMNKLKKIAYQIADTNKDGKLDLEEELNLYNEANINYLLIERYHGSKLIKRSISCADDKGNPIVEGAFVGKLLDEPPLNQKLRDYISKHQIR